MIVQKQFEKFNDKIRLDYSTNSELAKKRDILLGKLRSNEEMPSFKEFNQGSYAMSLGVEPQNGREYDIDVGLRFNKNKDDYTPMELKKKIDKILENHTEYGSEIKKPCVTVTYKKDGEAAYHVDLVVYTYENSDDKESQLYIAKGIDSDKNSQKWEKADPVGLVDYINDKINKGNERDQFRRVMRYLKRWKHLKFSKNGHVEPPSIGITLIVLENFYYCENDDFLALKKVVEVIGDKFTIHDYDDDGDPLYRIKLSLPCELSFDVNTDIFEKMTDRQMTDFKDKVDALVKNLNDVENETDEYEKCKKLNKIFGDDFEVPEEKNTAKKQYNYIPKSSASGLE